MTIGERNQAINQKVKEIWEILKAYGQESAVIHIGGQADNYYMMVADDAPVTIVRGGQIDG
jgi:hypothetical protein